MLTLPRVSVSKFILDFAFDLSQHNSARNKLYFHLLRLPTTSHICRASHVFCTIQLHRSYRRLSQHIFSHLRVVTSSRLLQSPPLETKTWCNPSGNKANGPQRLRWTMSCSSCIDVWWNEHKEGQNWSLQNLIANIEIHKQVFDCIFHCYYFAQ